MVATGPMPGSTPISVPSTQPMKQYSRLIGVTATPKPMARLETRSMFLSFSSADEPRPDRELQFQKQDEREVAADRQDHGQHRDFLGVETIARHRGDEREHDDADDHAEG